MAISLEDVDQLKDNTVIMDLLRNNKALEAINPILIERGVPELTADRLVWPIFRDHLIENPNIQQNNGWR